MWVAARVTLLVATAISWEARQARGSIQEQQALIVRTSLDAERLALAVSRPGVSVRASWIGNISLPVPIEVRGFLPFRWMSLPSAVVCPRSPTL